MAFSASFLVNGISYAVRSFRWGLQQNTDVVGRPDAQVHGGQLEVELDSRPDDTLHHWALQDTKKMNCELIVWAADNSSSSLKKIQFEDAYCVGLTKVFDGSGSGHGMTMTLTLSANKLTCGQVVHDNKWPSK